MPPQIAHPQLLQLGYETPKTPPSLLFNVSGRAYNGYISKTKGKQND